MKKSKIKNNPKKTIYIAWNEEEPKFIKTIYTGKGEYKNIFETVTTTKKARYFNGATQEMIDKANDYIKSDRPDAYIIIE